MKRGMKKKDLIVQKIASKIHINIKNHARHYHPRKSTDTLWEIISKSIKITEDLRRTYIIDLEERMCDCHNWEALGFSCGHALMILIHLRQNPHNYVEDCFHSFNYQSTYANPIFPIPDRIDWESTFTSDSDEEEENHSGSDSDSEDDVNGLIAVSQSGSNSSGGGSRAIHIYPPNTRHPSGHPKKKRIATSPERDLKIPKKDYHCGRCDGIGHNRKTCNAAI